MLYRNDIIELLMSNSAFNFIQKENDPDIILLTLNMSVEIWFGDYTQYFNGEVGRQYSYGYNAEDPCIIITKDKIYFNPHLHMRWAPIVVSECHNFDMSIGDWKCQ